MEYIVTANEMKQCDYETIHHFGVPSLVLMERAALCVVHEITTRFTNDKKVLIVAGSGNNGGDGFAIGRILWEKGFLVTFVLLGDKDKCSEQTKIQIDILLKYGLTINSKIEKTEYDIVVDAIFGIGLSRPIKSTLKENIELMNSLKTFVVAVDIPSGINSDDGNIMGCAVQASITVTFAYKKRGLLLFPGAKYAGEVIRVNIGIMDDSFLGKKPLLQALGRDDLYLLPDRKADGNKGTFGKALIISGSTNMSGASQLCALSCYRTGAGMVKIVTSKENRVIIQESIPEALLTTYKEEIDSKFLQVLEIDLDWSDVVAIGPGIGKSKQAIIIVKYILENCKKPIVIDADALNIMSEDKKLMEMLKKNQIDNQVIVTPHLGEFSRLWGMSIEKIKTNLIEEVGHFSKEYGVITVCKDSRTAISIKGDQSYINVSGNNGMATAGSGDVLTGIIIGLLAQGKDARLAATLGTYIHGLAGDFVSKSNNSYSLMASDLIDTLKYILKKEQ